MNKPQTLLDITLRKNVFKTTREARQAIQGGFVKVDEEVITDICHLITTNCEIQVGKQLPICITINPIWVTLPNGRTVSFTGYEWFVGTNGDQVDPPEAPEAYIKGQAFWDDSGAALTWEEMQELHTDSTSYMRLVDAVIEAKLAEFEKFEKPDPSDDVEKWLAEMWEKSAEDV